MTYKSANARNPEESFGASATPFVPVPFVDDWMLSRLLRRIAGKVLARHGVTVAARELPKKIVDAYVEAIGVFRKIHYFV